jgi:hypothetical protein
MEAMEAMVAMVVDTAATADMVVDTADTEDTEDTEDTADMADTEVSHHCCFIVISLRFVCYYISHREPGSNDVHLFFPFDMINRVRRRIRRRVCIVPPALARSRLCYSLSKHRHKVQR